jgi:hypothetical protein
VKVAVSEFVKRQVEESKFTHFNGTWEELRDVVELNIDNHSKGYRDGVILVKMPNPEMFSCSIVNIEEGLKNGWIERIDSKFEERREGELPYLQIFAYGEKQPAKRVDVVLYRHDVLEEGDEASSDAEWEIISINGSPTENEVPMNNTTRARNILVQEGGTDVKLEDKSKEELIAFIKDMAESSTFWKSHIMVQPEPPTFTKVCPDCGEPLFNTYHGLVCENGHGGDDWEMGYVSNYRAKRRAWHNKVLGE